MIIEAHDLENAQFQADMIVKDLDPLTAWQIDTEVEGPMDPETGELLESEVITE
jgi:hypothetical protein